MTTNLNQAIKNRIQKHDRAWCFSHGDFNDLGSYDAIRQTLSRLTTTGFINRLAKGIYCYPQHHKTLGELPVQIDAIIDVMKRTYKIRCQPSGAYAANLLGLSNQIPAKITILTDGPSKTLKVGNKEIIFKKTVPKNMETAGTMTGLIIQAIKYIGKDHITNQHLKQLKRSLTNDDINTLKKNGHLAPAWIAKLIQAELIGKRNG